MVCEMDTLFPGMLDEIRVCCVLKNKQTNPNVVLKLDGNCIKMVYQGQLCYSKPGMFDRGLVFCDKSALFLSVVS